MGGRSGNMRLLASVCLHLLLLSLLVAPYAEAFSFSLGTREGGHRTRGRIRRFLSSAVNRITAFQWLPEDKVIKITAGKDAEVSRTSVDADEEDDEDDTPGADATVPDNVNPDEPVGSAIRNPIQVLGDVFAQAPLASPPPPPVEPGACPPSASQCDFYFEGFEGEIPEFDVDKMSPDNSFTPSIKSSAKGAVIDVNVANTDGAEYVCDESGNAGDLPTSQFYANQEKVSARTFQTQPGKAAFKGKYVKLELTNVQLSVFGMLTNVNKGQENSYFAEDKRCLLFKLK